MSHPEPCGVTDTRALTGLPAHTCEQTRFLDPFATRTLSQALPGPSHDILPPHRALLGRPHPFLLGALVTSSTLPSPPLRGLLPLPLCPVSKLLPTRLPATCSAQGRGRSGLALLFAKAAACGHSLTLDQNAETCLRKQKIKEEEVRAAGWLPPLSFFLQIFPCPSSP